MTDVARAIRVRAHAKINLSLRVLGRRDDGFHDLRTVFQAVSLCDTLMFVSRPGPFALEAARSAAGEAGSEGLPLDDRNLVWRAANCLWRHLGRSGSPSDVLIRLEKRIPMRAGLGGGSADAAAAILGLARLWGAQLGPNDTSSLGRALGADVGFFFTGGAALGLGRGDEIYPMADLPRLGVLLVMPGFEVSTADAYRWVDEARGQVSGPSDRAPVPIPLCPWPPPANLVFNDFEPLVAPRHPELRVVTRALSAAGAAAVAMTGSGSSVFGLFEELGARDRAAVELAEAGHEVERAHTLSRRDYRMSVEPEACASPEAPDMGGRGSAGLSPSNPVV